MLSNWGKNGRRSIKYMHGRVYFVFCHQVHRQKIDVNVESESNKLDVVFLISRKSTNKSILVVYQFIIDLFVHLYVLKRGGAFANLKEDKTKAKWVKTK